MRLGRRSLLGALGTALACPVCTSLQAQPAPRGHGAAHWGYEGATGPAAWGKMSPANKACAIGVEQTPIDLRSAIPAKLGGPELSYRPTPTKIVNNGHTVQVNCAPGSMAMLDGTAFDLLQFHFHHPSEHLLDGKQSEIELHLVHKSASGALAVLGVMIKPGADNAALAPVWAAMPAHEGKEQKLAADIDPAALLPADRHFFRYVGSLTTPPCSEGVTWTVYKSPVEMSPAQIRQFAALFPMNARPAQPLNRRFLLEAG